MRYKEVYKDLYKKLEKFKDISESVELIHIKNKLYEILSNHVSYCPALKDIEAEIFAVMKIVESSFLSQIIDLYYNSDIIEWFWASCLLFFILNIELFIEIMRDIETTEEIIERKIKIIEKILNISDIKTDIKTSEEVDDNIYYEINNLIGKPTLEESEELLEKQRKVAEFKYNKKIEDERINRLKRQNPPLKIQSYTKQVMAPITRTVNQNAGRKTKRRIKRKTKRKYIHIYK